MSDPESPAKTQISWPQFLLAAGCGLTLVFTFLRPGSSEALTGATLMAFWALHIFGALALLQVAQMGLMRVRWGLARGPWLQIALSGLIGAVLFTPLATGLDQLFGVADVTDDAEETGGWLFLGEFLAFAPIVLLIWFGLNATRLVHLAPQQRAVPQADPQQPIPEFWARTPPHIGTELVALSAELHYLRITTTQGDALILYPFGKAVAALEPQGTGLQVHRSHWVSRAQIAQVQRRGQGAICIMQTGQQIPVSRRYRKALMLNDIPQ